MTNFIKVVGVIILLLGVACAALWMPNFQKDKIEKWCGENGYDMVSCERPWFSTGPFWFVDPDSESVYKVKVRNKSGEKVIWFKFCMFNRLEWKEQ